MNIQYRASLCRVPNSESYIVDTSVLGTFSNEPGEAGGSLS